MIGIQPHSMRHGLLSDSKDDEGNPKLCSKVIKKNPSHTFWDSGSKKFYRNDGLIFKFFWRKHLYKKNGICRRCKRSQSHEVMDLPGSI